MFLGSRPANTFFFFVYDHIHKFALRDFDRNSLFLFVTSVFLFVTSVFLFVTSVSRNFVVPFRNSVFLFVTSVFLFVPSVFLFVPSVFLFETGTTVRRKHHVELSGLYYFARGAFVA